MEASDAGGAEHGLVAKGGVFFHFKVGDLKAGARQQVEANRRHVNGTADAGADAGGDAALVSADVYRGGRTMAATVSRTAKIKSQCFQVGPETRTPSSVSVAKRVPF